MVVTWHTGHPLYIRANVPEVVRGGVPRKTIPPRNGHLFECFQLIHLDRTARRGTSVSLPNFRATPLPTYVNSYCTSAASEVEPYPDDAHGAMPGGRLERRMRKFA